MLPACEMDTPSGIAIPTFGVAYRMAELLTTLRRLKPDTKYSLSAPREKQFGNVDVRIESYAPSGAFREEIVHLPTKLRNGRWLLTAWQFLEFEIELAEEPT